MRVRSLAGDVLQLSLVLCSLGPSHAHCMCLAESFIIVSSPLSAGPPCALAAISLQLDSEYSPPPFIPSDPSELIYSAPAMDHMLEPIKVQVLDGSGNLLNESVTVVATTVLASNANSSGNPGDTYNGTLCQHNLWTHRYATCRYTGDNCVELSCNSSDLNYPLGKVEVVAEDGVAEFPRLLHTEPSTNGQRILRFFAEHDGNSAEVETNAFDVDCKLLCSLLEVPRSTVWLGHQRL